MQAPVAAALMNVCLIHAAGTPIWLCGSLQRRCMHETHTAGIRGWQSLSDIIASAYSPVMTTAPSQVEAYVFRGRTKDTATKSIGML